MKSDKVKKVFTVIGISLFFMSAAFVALQFLGAKLIDFESSAEILQWVVSFLPLYVICMPIGMLIMKKVPADAGTGAKLGAKNFFLFLLMCFPLMYGGNIIGTILSLLLSGGTATNALTSLMEGSLWLRLLVVVIVAPIMEELFFRKFLIDRTVRYGEKTAILFSSVSFALFHMNLYQFFYAFGLGMLFGYVYTRTRQLKYSAIMHMVVNFLGMIAAPLILEKSGLLALSANVAAMDDAALIQALPGLGLYFAYVLLLIGLSIAGLIVLIKKVPKFVFVRRDEEIPKGQVFTTVYLNMGVILFVLFCVAMCVVSLFNGGIS